jgi:hypothetical protein
MAQDESSRVGYGKPPPHTRFRKGQSGNPSGRPRRPTDLASLLTRALNRPAASEGRNTGTQREAIVAALVEKSAAGDLRATKLLFELMRQLGPPAEPTVSPEDDPREILLQKLARLAAASGRGENGVE